MVVLEEEFFLCAKCRKINSHIVDYGEKYEPHINEVIRSIRLGTEKIRE